MIIVIIERNKKKKKNFKYNLYRYNKYNLYKIYIISIEISIEIEIYIEIINIISIKYNFYFIIYLWYDNSSRLKHVWSLRYYSRKKDKRQETGKDLYHVTLLKKRLWHRHFPWKFCEISKNTFSYRKLPVAASIK